VNDLVLAEGMGNGLAHATIGKKRIFQIVPQVGVGRGRIAVLGEAGTKLGGIRLPGILDRRESHQVHAACLEFQVHGGIVGDDPVDVTVNVRAALVVVVIGFEDDLLTGDPFLEPVGPGSDGTTGEFTLGDVLPFQQVSRENSHPPGGQRRGERLGIGDAKGVGIGCLGGLDLLEILGVRSGGLRIHRHPVGVEHVTGGELHAVVPFHPLAEMESDGEAVGRNLPRLGQFPLQVQVLVVTDKAVEDIARHLVGCRVGRQQRKQVRRFANGTHHDGVTVSGRTRSAHGRGSRAVFAAARYDQQQGKKAADPPERHFSWLSPLTLRFFSMISLRPGSVSRIFR